MREIDERIVEMRFDNKQFESATKETMGTLDKLKRALNMDSAAKGFDEIEKASGKVKFNKIQESLSALEKRFSAFGVFTSRIIEKAADDIYATVKSRIGGAISYVTNAIKEGGLKRATNMENAHFQLQALLKDEEKVQAVMADASAAVDGTAYSLDEAAKAASQFAASGIQAGDDMKGALRGIVGVSAMTNREFGEISRIFTTVAGNGRVMGDQLLQLSERGLNAASTLADFFNGVNDGSKQASDEVTAMVQNLTGGMQVGEAEIREWVSKGKINFKMFSEAMTEAFAESAERANETYNGALSNMRSAFARIGEAFYKPLIAQNSDVVRLINSVRVRINDVKSALVFNEEVGNVNALAKQWTDFVLSLASSAADWVDNVDLTKPLEAFYYGVESAKNVGKGLLGILGPIGTAFKNVFHDYLKMDNLVIAMTKLEELTSKFKVTTKGAANLRRTFRGVFDVIDLIIEGITDFIKAIIPCKTSTDGLGDSVLGLTGDLGSLLSRFVEWIRESKTLNKTFDILTTGIRKTIEFVLNINTHIKNLIKTLRGIPEVNKFIEAMSDLFQGLGKKATPYVKDLKEGLKYLGDEVMGWDWHKPVEWLGLLADKIEALAKILLDEGGMKTAADNAKSYMDKLKEAFSFENVVDKFEGMKKAVSGIKKWVEKNLGPAFEGFTFGNALAAAGGGGLVYALVKMADSFKIFADVVSGFKQIPKFFDEVNNTLKAYQNDLNATALLKVAGAIGVLALVLVGLSFIDTKRLYAAAGALSLVAGVIGGAITAIIYAMNKGQGIEKASTILANGLDKGIQKIATGIKWKMILQGVKEMGKAVAYIAGSIVAIALMYQKNPEATEQASTLVAMICGFLITAVALFGIAGDHMDKGMKNLQKAGAGVLEIAIALNFIVFAMKGLFNLNFPEDAEDRLFIVGECLLAIAALEVILSEVGKKADGKIKIFPILSIAASVVLVVFALKELFAMNIPDDAGFKLVLLAGIFGSLAIMVLAIGKAGGKGETTIKAAGTILAMCAFVAVIVAALMILSLVPFTKLLSGAIALGICLVALGGALWGASKLADDNSAKTVFNMAVVVGAIAASLTVLSLIKWTALAKACAALGAMLIVVAGDFLAISKMTNDKIWSSILAMVGIIATITISLMFLAGQPWTGLLAGAVALGLVLEVFADVLKKISGRTGIKIEKISLFLLAITSLVPITWALMELSNQPWEGLLASAVALGLVSEAMADVVCRISRKTGIKIEKISLFILASAALLPIVYSIGELSGQPWEGLLASAVALSLVLEAITISFAIIAGVKSSEDMLLKIGEFYLILLAIIPIGITLAVLGEYSWGSFKTIADSISELLLALAATFAIIVEIGAVSAGAYSGMIAFGVFLIGFSAILLLLGLIMQWEVTANLLNGGLEVMGKLGSAIGDFVGNIIAGIGSGVASAIEDIGAALGAFWEKGEPFFDGMAGVDPKTLDGVKTIAQAVLFLAATDVIDGILSFVGIETTSLQSFAEQLANAAPSIKEYADGVSGIDSGAVAASSTAVKTMAEAAAALPRQADWYDKIFGSKKTLAEFAEELEAFAPAIKRYSNIVSSGKGIDSEAVEASTNAAGLLSELANGLPEYGGILQDWLGEKVDLETFGTQLESFGNSLVTYSSTVSAEGAINSGAIENSKDAAQLMVDLANNLPLIVDAIGFFAGKQDIATFGEQLVSFGGSIATYSAIITGYGGITGGIDTAAVEASARAFQMLADLQGTLGRSGGQLQWVFGEEDISDFGDKLIGLGQGMKAYYDEIQTIDPGTMSDITKELKYLADVVKNLPQTADLLPAFVTQLEEAGMSGVSGFINAFKNSSLNLSITALSWGMGVKEAFKKSFKQKDYTQIGTDIINWITNGITKQQTLAKINIIAICGGITSTFKTNLQSTTFQKIGSDIMTAFRNGVNNGKAAAVNAITDFANSISNVMQSKIQNQNYFGTGMDIVTKIANGMSASRWLISNVAVAIQTDIYNAFYGLGDNAGKGLEQGLRDRIGNVKDAAIAAANAATEAAKRALRERSPSKLWEGLGINADKGLENGLLGYLRQLSAAGTKVAETATDPIALAFDAMNGLLENEYDNDLTITPVLDLSDIRNGAKKIGDLLGGKTFSTTFNGLAGAIGSFEKRKVAEESLYQEAPTDAGNQSPTFIQNNYSPKALSRLDIYRQTRNQFTMFERMAKQT